MVVEIDGGERYLPETGEYDGKRTGIPEENGIKVIGIINRGID